MLKHTLRRTALAALIPIAGWLCGCGKSNPDGAQADNTNAFAPSAAPAGFHLLIEAESIPTIAAPMTVTDDSDAGGGKCVTIPVGLPKDAPLTGRLETTLDIPAAAKAYCWYRVYWNGSCSNSVTAKLGDFPEFIVGEDGTYNAWHWVKSPPLPLQAGPLTLTIGQREEDIRIDQILITSDADYVPVSIEE